MARKERWVKKVIELLKNSDVCISKLPTKILFVSNSSVMCGVQLEDLESVFFKYDTKCNFIVYPKHKSYSFVTFSNVDFAILAFNELNDTKPPNFEKEIALFYVTNLPNEKLKNETFNLNGLDVFFDFINEIEENNLIDFVSSCKSFFLKNRRVLHFGYEFDYSKNNALIKTTPIPNILNEIISKILSTFDHNNKSLLSFQPNQVTVNIYETGQGIPPHVDTHSAFEECIVSLSLLSDVVMEFRDCANIKNCIDVLLPARSLLIMTGEARYRYKHGILNRKYDVNPLNNRLLKRNKRISITFRQIRLQPCNCSFIEFCDWNRNGKTKIPENNLHSNILENEYVIKVYEEIADHFDETRKSNWKMVNNFLDSLPDYSVLLDAGCGNGKYLLRKDLLCKIGIDICQKLVKISYAKNCFVLCGDAMRLPIKSNSVDAAISIAVIHHFSTKERRLKALIEIQRVLKRGGSACVTVWAMKQTNDFNDIESSYMKMKKIKNDDICLNTEENLLCDKKKLVVHDGCSSFVQQDIFIPWNLKQKNAKSTEKNKQYLRYYHLFIKNELEELIKELKECRLKKIEFEEGNWGAIFEKT